MPELPEVESARRALAAHCVGKRVVRCAAADDAKVIDGVAPRKLEAALVGRTILDVRRKGKNLWLVLDARPFPTFQFGMAGAFYIKGVETSKYKRSAVSPSEEWPSKYSKVFVELDEGLEFSFTDKRRFAKVRLVEDPESVSPISELGPDALDELMPPEDFMKVIGQRKIAIKALLLDQGFISGIGNWIADEVLYQARIHPMEVAANLSKESCVLLQKKIKEVICKAVEAEADSSQFPNNWIYHSRERKPGKAFVDGKMIEFITAGGRTSAFVPELQKLSTKADPAEPGEAEHDGMKSRRRASEKTEPSGAGKSNAKEKSKKSNKASVSTKLHSTDVHGDIDSEGTDGDDNVDMEKPGKGRKRTAKVEKSSSVSSPSKPFRGKRARK